jgi:hypothetical protein
MSKRPSVVDDTDLIRIKPSPTADTRTCDWSKVSKEQLCASSISHREDVHAAFMWIVRMMLRQAALHDHDKLSNIDGFHKDFATGFKQTKWWDEHRRINRHHLLQADGVPDDVNLIDVLDMVVDCTMAGIARSGSLYEIDIDLTVLVRAFKNTFKLLEAHTVVEPTASLASTRGKQDCTQDHYENCPFASTGGLNRRGETDVIVPHYVSLQDVAEYLRGYGEQAELLYGPDWRTTEFSWKPALVIESSKE